MMELDCFITRKKQLGEDFDDLLVLESQPGEKSGQKRIHQNRRLNGQPTWALSDILARNANSKEIKCRLYSALACTGMGIFCYDFVHDAHGCSLLHGSFLNETASFLYFHKCYHYIVVFSTKK